MPATCPWCSATRDEGPTCPKCGAIYAKAAAIKAHGSAKAVIAAAPVGALQPADPVLDFELDVDNSAGEWQLVDDADLEWKFCVAAIPVALLVSLVVYVSGIGAFLLRLFLSMPVHELGHAFAAWFSGFDAIPTVWKTLVPETRGFVMPLGLLAGLGWLGWRAWAAGNRVLLGTACTLVLLQLALTFGTSVHTAKMVIVFCGDGGGMILAVLLMGSFFFGKRTQLYKGSLRWGFVVIGAATYVDIYGTWVKARRDFDAIPLGSQDGMAADPLVLIEQHGWTLASVANRYFVLGLLCFAALAAVYAWGVRRAAQERDARASSRRLAERMAGRGG